MFVVDQQGGYHKIVQVLIKHTLIACVSIRLNEYAFDDTYAIRRLLLYPYDIDELEERIYLSTE